MMTTHRNTPEDRALQSRRGRPNEVTHPHGSPKFDSPGPPTESQMMSPGNQNGHGDGHNRHARDVSGLVMTPEVGDKENQSTTKAPKDGFENNMESDPEPAYTDHRIENEDYRGSNEDDSISGGLPDGFDPHEDVECCSQVLKRKGRWSPSLEHYGLFISKDQNHPTELMTSPSGLMPATQGLTIGGTPPTRAEEPSGTPSSLEYSPDSLSETESPSLERLGIFVRKYWNHGRTMLMQLLAVGDKSPTEVDRPSGTPFSHDADTNQNSRSDNLSDDSATDKEQLAACNYSAMLTEIRNEENQKVQEAAKLKLKIESDQENEKRIDAQMEANKKELQYHKEQKVGMEQLLYKVEEIAHLYTEKYHTRIEGYQKRAAFYTRCAQGQLYSHTAPEKHWQTVDDFNRRIDEAKKKIEDFKAHSNSQIEALKEEIVVIDERMQELEAMLHTLLASKELVQEEEALYGKKLGISNRIFDMKVHGLKIKAENCRKQLQWNSEYLDNPNPNIV